MQINLLNIRLIVKLGTYSMSEFPIDIDGKTDLHTIVENGQLQRTYDQALLIEYLNETHEHPWSRSSGNLVGPLHRWFLWLEKQEDEKAARAFAVAAWCFSKN